jgi:hypothetical protein
MSYWLGFGDAMGSLAGAEQSARQPSVRLQLAKIPVPTGLPDEEPEDGPEEDPEEGAPDEEPEEGPPEEEPEDGPEDEPPDDEPEPDPPLELPLLPGVEDPEHAGTPSAIKPSA